MNFGWCMHGMKCKFHHPKWNSEEHHTLRDAFNEKTNRNWYGGKRDRKQGWWRGGHEGEQEQGGWWEQETYGKSSGQSEYRNAQDEQQPKTQVYRDRENWHYVRLHVSEAVSASIKNNKTTSNKDVSMLLKGITEAAWDMLDLIHSGV